MGQRVRRYTEEAMRESSQMYAELVRLGAPMVGLYKLNAADPTLEPMK
jgi:arginine decarboxylase-like protein